MNLPRKLLACCLIPISVFIAVPRLGFCAPTVHDWVSPDWVAIKAKVDTSGAAGGILALAGGSAGEVDIRTGVNIDVGTGTNQDELSYPTTSLNGGDHSFLQVAPRFPGEELHLEIRGNVIIRCQYLFSPTSVKAIFEPGQPPPSLTVYAGQSLWVFNNPCTGPTDEYCEARPTPHGGAGSVPTQFLFNPPELVANGQRVFQGTNGGKVTIWTSQRGNLNASIQANGGHSYTNGADGGKGGVIRLVANDRSITFFEGFPARTPFTITADGGHGAKGGDGGQLLIQGTNCAPLAISGSGGNGGWGGSGGDGAAINIACDIPAGVAQVSIPGGGGGHGAVSGTGGSGGDAGYAWGISPPANPALLDMRGGNGGPGGDGTPGTVGTNRWVCDPPFTTNCTWVCTGGTPGGAGGNGGRGGDASGLGVPGVGGQGGGGGSGGCSSNAPNGSKGGDGKSGQPPPIARRLEPESPVLDAWTFMVYICADADKSLEKQQAWHNFLAQLEEVAFKNANIIVFLDRPYVVNLPGFPYWQGLGTWAWSWSEGRVGFIARNNLPSNGELGSSALLPLGGHGIEQNSASAGTLEAFVNWAALAAPAANYAFLYVGHGSGWKGIAQDIDHPGSSCSLMPVQEFGNAVRRSAEHLGTVKKFGVVGLYGCRSQTMEMAAELTGAAKYMFGSEPTMQIPNHSLKGWLDALSDKPEMNVEELSAAIWAHGPSYHELDPRLAAWGYGVNACSLVDLDELPELLEELTRISDRLQSNRADLCAAVEAIPFESAIRSSSRQEAYVHFEDKDLGHFLDSLRRSSMISTELKSLVETAAFKYDIAIERRPERGSGFTGLSVYLPTPAKLRDKTITLRLLPLEECGAFYKNDGMAFPRLTRWAELIQEFLTCPGPGTLKILTTDEDISEEMVNAYELGNSSDDGVLAVDIYSELGAESDEDLYQFTAIAGEQIAVRGLPTDTIPDSIIVELLAADGNTVLATAHGISASGGVVIDGHTINTQDSHFIRVRNCATCTNGFPRDYLLSVAIGSPAELAPKLSTDVSKVEFKNLVANHVGYQGVVVRNAGFRDLNITGLQLPTNSAVRAKFQEDVLPFVLGPGEATVLDLSLEGTNSFSENSTVRLFSNSADGGSAEITIEANVVEQPSIQGLEIGDGSMARGIVLLPRSGGYRLEVSTNLIQWHTLTNGSTTDLGIKFEDTSGSNHQSRFYRAVLE